MAFSIFLLLSSVLLGAIFYLALVPKKDTQSNRYFRYWVLGICFIVGSLPLLVLTPTVFLLVTFFSIFAFTSNSDKLFAVSLAKWLGCFGIHKFYLVRNANKSQEAILPLVQFLLASVLWLAFWHALFLGHPGISIICGAGLVFLIVRGIMDSAALNAMSEEEFRKLCKR